MLTVGIEQKTVHVYNEKKCKRQRI